jgi:CBS domain containing-hemolysin-like protein
LNGTGNALLRLLGVEPASGHELVHSVEEIRMLVSASAESGVVMADESEMLKAIFDFRNLLVRQVMIPRTEMVVVEAETPLEDIICLVSESTFTKFPVFEDDLDNIIGIVHFKDLLNIMQSEAWEMTTARKLAREPIFVPETATVSGLLSHLRASRQHIAIIMDEFGGTAGLVTLEDLLEEIVGEISDPFDIVVPEFQHLPDGSTLVDGRIMIEDVNEQLGLELNDPHYDTIAGYVLGKLGRIPKPDDIVEGDGVHIRVHEMDGMRISRIELTILGAPDQMELPAQKKDND